jgi:hypothetical protein
MDTTILVDQLYEEGKKLIINLDNEGFKFPIALWINIPERNGWILLFGVPKLKDTGAKAIFKHIHDTIIKNKIDISLNDLTLVDTTNDICQSLKMMMRTGYGVGKTSFFGNIINGQRFPDSVIYRVN